MSQEPSIPRLFDLTAQRRNRARAAAGFSGFDFLKREAAIRIADGLELMRRDFPLCLDFGCHDGTLTRYIRETGKVGTVIQADIVPAFATRARNEGPPVVLDVEALPFASQGFDAAFSCVISFHFCSAENNGFWKRKEGFCQKVYVRVKSHTMFISSEIQPLLVQVGSILGK